MCDNYLKEKINRYGFIEGLLYYLVECRSLSIVWSYILNTKKLITMLICGIIIAMLSNYFEWLKWTYWMTFYFDLANDLTRAQVLLIDIFGINDGIYYIYILEQVHSGKVLILIGELIAVTHCFIKSGIFCGDVYAVGRIDNDWTEITLQDVSKEIIKDVFRKSFVIIFLGFNMLLLSTMIG